MEYSANPPYRTFLASPPSEFDLEEEYYNARPQYIPQAQGMSPKHRIEGKSKGTRPSSITIPAATSFLPTLEASNSAPLTSASGTFNDKGGKRSAKSSASHRRTRSMSIPPTPGSPLGAVNVRRPSSLWKIYLILCFSYFPQNLPGVYETVGT